MSRVVSYKPKWDMNSHSGQIELKLSTGTFSNPHGTFVTTLHTQTPDEMSLLVDLLRNEKPLDYSTTTKQLVSTEWEVIGEGE